jgi:hypothetical protein
MSDPVSTESTGYTDQQLRELVAHLSDRTRRLQQAGQAVILEAGAIEQDVRRVVLELTRRLDELGDSLSGLGSIVEKHIRDGGDGKREQRKRGTKRRSKVTKKAG